MVEKLDIKRDLSRNPLFDTMFVLQNMDMKVFEILGLKATSMEFKLNTSKFDMTLSAYEALGQLEFSLEYCTKLYKKETIERLSNHYINILKAIIDESNAKLRKSAC